MRVLRVFLGALLLLCAAPLLCAGIALVAAGAHRTDDGTFGARVAELHSDGYAVVVPDLDALLRSDLPFTRAGETTVRVSVVDSDRPAFLGLAPRAQVARYLAGVPHTEILAAGISTAAMPVTLATVAGDQPPPSLPSRQSFWLATSETGSLNWAAAAIRGQQFSLVLMSVDASAGLTLGAQAAFRPGWLSPTSWAMIGLGAVGVVVSVAILLAAARRRDPATEDLGAEDSAADSAAGDLAVTDRPAPTSPAPLHTLSFPAGFGPGAARPTTPARLLAARPGGSLLAARPGGSLPDARPGGSLPDARPGGSLPDAGPQGSSPDARPGSLCAVGSASPPAVRPSRRAGQGLGQRERAYRDARQPAPGADAGRLARRCRAPPPRAGLRTDSRVGGRPRRVVGVSRAGGGGRAPGPGRHPGCAAAPADVAVRPTASVQRPQAPGRAHPRLATRATSTNGRPGNSIPQLNRSCFSRPCFSRPRFRPAPIQPPPIQPAPIQAAPIQGAWIQAAPIPGARIPEARIQAGLT